MPEPSYKMVLQAVSAAVCLIGFAVFAALQLKDLALLCGIFAAMSWAFFGVNWLSDTSEFTREMRNLIAAIKHRKKHHALRKP
jgi:hypothetical protein